MVLNRVGQGCLVFMQDPQRIGLMGLELQGLWQTPKHWNILVPIPQKVRQRESQL